MTDNVVVGPFPIFSAVAGVIEREATIVVDIVNKTASGVALSSVDRERLTLATARIKMAQSLIPKVPFDD